MDKAKKAAEIEKAEENGENIGTQFSKETRVRDEDEEMQKFIEKEMEKRRGKRQDSDPNEHEKYLTPEEAALLSLPDHLKKSQSKKNEEMLSSQMLSGIPEVDLGQGFTELLNIFLKIYVTINWRNFMTEFTMTGGRFLEYKNLF